MTNVELEKEFQERFIRKAENVFFCPGRVNLIGEHIDYNGGQVMPCTISRGTWLLVNKNDDKVFRLQCLNFPEEVELPVQSSYKKTGKEWFNYPLSIINQLIQDGHELSGLDMLYYGNLPIGAGLSSSASIQVITAVACNDLFNLDIDGVAIALLAKKAENEFIGLSSGIMDQFAVALGKKNKVILLNCDTLDYEYIPIDTNDYTLAVINSKKQRALAESKYNERVGECSAALKILQKEIVATYLCDITPEQYASHQYLITDPVLAKRAKHVITENERVMQAKMALQKNNLNKLGELMYASHESLQADYEVSGKELDTIVEFCKSYKGCIGGRMTGAGFGGCAIALVRKDLFEDFADKLSSYYANKIGNKPEVFASVIGDGAGRVKN